VVLRDILKLFHPVIPFVTEELWSNMAEGPDLLITSTWPDVPAYTAPDYIDSLQAIVSGVRAFRSQHQVPRATAAPVIVVADDELPDWWLEQVGDLANCEPSQGQRPEPPTGHTRLSGPGVEAFIPLAGLVDIDAERPRLEKAIAELESSIAKSEAKLGNPSFRERAPSDVVAQEEERLAELRGEADKQRSQLADLG
jgi:valyl-tRNA synthetase